MTKTPEQWLEEAAPEKKGGTLKLEGATDIKDWAYLKDMKSKGKYQLSEIAEGARENGDKFNLIIAPET